ncbi:hypothetical protein J8A87_24215 [Vibrio parahaemolyticus]|uniref:hypothetical protein n=1 Tax=Vibrio TaxID=662 RepID=UPI0029646286|nr:hypothetical protein [Vibrio sp. Vb0587]MBE4779316.1 hypothetical protein [Vibrio parahaemolyticus]MCF9167547.1 hypothetical protein [Vibrio parahaemolyticus]MDG3413373.1 hypothetical protein [Vibrio parahaemolyticus]MDW1964084.1 hypothetical protein [Vibrio sp. Vb0587]
MNFEFDDLVKICKLKEVNRLLFALDSFEYSNPIFAFAYKHTPEGIQVCDETVEWIKTSRRCCDSNDGMNSADYKIGKLLDKLFSATEDFDSFEFGFVDNISKGFTSYLSFNRSSDRAELHDSIKSLIRLQHAAFHDNPKYSKVVYGRHVLNKDELTRKFAEFLMDYCIENNDKANIVTDQNSVIKTFPDLIQLSKDFMESSGLSFGDQKQQLNALSALTTSRIIHIGWSYQDITDESVWPIVERIYGEANSENYERLMKEKSNEVMAYFMLDVNFIKSFRLKVE